MSPLALIMQARGVLVEGSFYGSKCQEIALSTCWNSVPSHYDDDGYVIRWWRAIISSNSLAAIYGIEAER